MGDGSFTLLSLKPRRGEALEESLTDDRKAVALVCLGLIYLLPRVITRSIPLNLLSVQVCTIDFLVAYLPNTCLFPGWSC